MRGVKPGQGYLQVGQNEEEIKQVGQNEEEIKQAPTLEPGGDLSAEDEARIYRYYGFEYQPPISGHRLVRR